jgi:SAM-dependent methyltransferase
MPADVWDNAERLERYVGRWSRLVAREFVDWLDVPPGGRWLEVGCGSGALTATVVELAEPASVVGIDSSAPFVEYAAAQVADPRASFAVGDAQALDHPDASFDVVASSLVLNFLPDPGRGVAEMARVVRPGGVVAGFVWDYAGEMQMMRRFWDVAVELDPAASDLDEGRRMAGCNPPALEALVRGAGLVNVETRGIDVPTVFADFEDYWTPFEGGQGPGPGYCVALPPGRRDALRERLRETLPVETDGSIRLIARAWAVRGTTCAPSRNVGLENGEGRLFSRPR